MAGVWNKPISRSISVLRGEFKQEKRRCGEYHEIQGALINACKVLK